MRHLAIGLGLAPGGGFILGKFLGWFLCDMGHLGISKTSKHILTFVQEIFFCQWKRCGLPRTSYNFKHWVAGLLLLSTATVLFSFRRFKICADILPITAGRSTSTISACTDFEYGCWDPWRTPGMIPSLGFQSHHMLLTSYWASVDC